MTGKTRAGTEEPKATFGGTVTGDKATCQHCWKDTSNRIATIYNRFNRREMWLCECGNIITAVYENDGDEECR